MLPLFESQYKGRRFAGTYHLRVILCSRRRNNHSLGRSSKPCVQCQVASIIPTVREQSFGILERSHSWPSALAWKASTVQAVAGSNPALSAIYLRDLLHGRGCCATLSAIYLRDLLHGRGCCATLSAPYLKPIVPCDEPGKDLTAHRPAPSRCSFGSVLAGVFLRERSEEREE